MSHYWSPNGGSGGTLAWLHEQQGKQSSYYLVYYDGSDVRSGVPPRSWLGDGDIPYVPRAAFPQVLMIRPAAFDWDGDGRSDVIVGDQLGYVALYRNTGSKSSPAFGMGEPIIANEKAVKVQWCAAPAVVDWNGDGLPDLLVAQEPQGVIRYYQNVGTRKSPILADRGLVQADGEVLKPPYLPVPEMPPGIFGDTYGSIPTAVDWDGDGKLDLLLGSYITGQFYLYAQAGKNPDGTPVLRYSGPLSGEAGPLDVTWNSTPSVADLNGDGKLDLVSGSFGMSSTGSDRPEDSRIHYFVRNGTSMHELPFPFEGDESSILQKLAENGGAPFSTALADLNADGLTDLLIGTNGGTVVYFPNVGDAKNPQFRFSGTLEGSWVPNRWNFDSIVDFHENGQRALLEGLYGTKVTLRTNWPDKTESIELKTVSGKSIGRPASHGDNFGNAQMYDFDRDGKRDLIFGTVDGRVLLYRNVGTRHEPAFADVEMMHLSSGAPLVAGFPDDTNITDFTVLQGNRAIPAAADFDGDQKTDLIVGNAIGQVLFFKNVGDNAKPAFAAPVQLLEREGRVFLVATDWNRDGIPDLVVTSGGKRGKQISILLHGRDPGSASFLPVKDIPAQTEIPYPVPAVIDWDQDGDQDLLVASSYGFVYRFDGSFIEHGYAKADLIKHESRRKEAKGVR
ncbi:MAG TPA: VCBS repeat-containing protein [Terriglobales bacterium]|nr:VCBS repeat-containing protein [Terriglobales bacterium]